MAGGKRRRGSITIQLDSSKETRRLSRNAFGRPGQGRKTSHVDRKKKSNKQSCRQWRSGKKEES